MKQTPAPQPPSSTYRQRSAAHLLGVSASCLRAWDRKGIGPRRIRIPGTRAVLYAASSLAEFQRKNEVDPADVVK